jgi:hypothetical protein
MATLIAVACDPTTPLNTFALHVDGEEVVISDLIQIEPTRYHPYRITPTLEAQIRAQALERMGWTITWAAGQEPV